MPYANWIHRYELKPGSWIFVPDDETRAFGTELKHELLENWKVPSNYWHLLPGGHVRAIDRHVGDDVFMRIDIQNFFGSINRTRITRVLKTMMRYDRARDAARRSVVPHPDDHNTFILPFGFVQSPIIASVCLRQSALGRYVEELSKLKGITTTVYMDDILISIHGESHSAQDIFETLRQKAERSEFVLSEKKLTGPTDSVTAFNIDVNHSGMSITNERLQEFITRCVESDNVNTVEGIRSYVTQVDSQQAQILESEIRQR
jgi:hypothetical protein